MTFVPGKSGNPSGRPKVDPEVKELARAASPKAIRKLVKLMDSKDERIALGASNSVLDRAWGKPAQAVTGEGGEGPLVVNIIRHARD